MTVVTHARHCIIPAAAIYEPDYRKSKPFPARIIRADGIPLGIAGLWERWHNPATGQVLYSYTMLTVNADDHAFMRNYYKPDDEKRMVVILPQGLYNDCLTLRPAIARSLCANIRLIDSLSHRRMSMIDEQLAILLADWHEQLNDVVDVKEIDGWHAALRRTIDDLKASGSIDAL